MSRYGDVFVFDADDTLWMTEWQYSHSYATFFAYLYEVLGDQMPNLHLVRDRFFEIEAGLYGAWGIKRGRVAEAMSLTYIEVCDWIRWRFTDEVYSEAHESRIREIGDMPFDYTKLRYLPGVQDTLTRLAAIGAHLNLLSSYDSDVFPGKAQFLGLHTWFSPERIRLVDGKKKTSDFIEVSGWATDEYRDSRTWYAVGNGESDIKPALEIAENWRGIYIPQGSTSRYFKDDGSASGFTPPPLDHPRVVTIRDFRELMEATSTRSLR